MTTERPTSRFEFVAMASARARQLLAGCRPRVESDSIKPARIAQREVKHGALWVDDAADAPGPES
jgi:DNA-directed RNA polymerase subunit K/omega